MLSDALRADGVKANIKGEPTPGVTGQFLVWSNKQLVWDKKGADGDCTEKNVKDVVEKIKQKL